jgi:DNA-binding NtrC family response regulator
MQDEVKQGATLLAIVELGGYPNFTRLYERLGFRTEFVNSQRRAQARLKKQMPDVIVAEFNYQSDFRDRSSNLESLMARLQRHPETRVIVFYQREHADKFQRFRSRFCIFDAVALPVDPDVLEDSLRRAMAG